MKKFLLAVTFLFWIHGTFAQNFFDTDFDSSKHYILICDPTIHRIETIEFLISNNILRLNTHKYEFVGLYFENQNYDFTQTKEYIENRNYRHFHLQEIKGKLKENELFKTNKLSLQFKKAFENSVGVIFFGGPDIPPGIYGEENTKSVVTDPQRHYFEASFLFHLLGGFQNNAFKPYLEERKDYIVTGFCLGMQTMNVATGGTLVQDIPEEIYQAENAEETVKIDRNNLHRNYWQEIVRDSLLMGINLHTIQATDHPFFRKEVRIRKNFSPRILSSHHQSAEKIGKNLEVIALSPDKKVVEGLAHSNYPNVFAVQFHPEVPALYEDMDLRKFAPEDLAKSYHQIIGRRSVRFHKAYWKYISKALKGRNNK